MNDSELVDYEETVDNSKKPKLNCTTAQFKDFLLRDELNIAIKDVAFEHPSEVQELTIPKAILGLDILCQAKSGTGKTAVFVLSTLQQLESVNKTAVIVIAHTKELVEQIRAEYQRFAAKIPNVTVEAVCGGMDDEVFEKLPSNPPTVIVGTSGKVWELVTQKKFDMSHVKFFVIDECDKALEDLYMRFEIQTIFCSTPRKKQTMMFTATLNDEMKADCLRFMDNPHEVYVDEEAKLTLYGLDQKYVRVLEHEKNNVLEKILNDITYDQSVIFCSTIKRCLELLACLESKSIPSLVIHSRMSTVERKEKLKKFKDYEYRIMVTTNLLSRGIDILHINLVVNYDMPECPETYLHRVGRAGRFETEGTAITFVSDNNDSAILNEVQRRFAVAIQEYEIK